MSIVADYELDAFELPDVRADWLVQGIKIEQHQIRYTPRADADADGTSWDGVPGRVLQLVDITRMSRWADHSRMWVEPSEGNHTGADMTYVVDLSPP